MKRKELKNVKKLGRIAQNTFVLITFALSMYLTSLFLSSHPKVVQNVILQCATHKNKDILSLDILSFSHLRKVIQ